MQKNTSDSQQQKKGRLILLSLVIFFVSPLVLVMYMYKIDWHPEGQSIGHLIKPVVLLEVPSAFQALNRASKIRVMFLITYGMTNGVLCWSHNLVIKPVRRACMMCVKFTLH